MTRTLTTCKRCRWESVVSTWKMSEEGQPLQGCLGTPIQFAEQRANLPADTLTSACHPRAAPAHPSMQNNTASLRTLQQGNANLGWDSGICRIPESPNLASKGCYSGNATRFSIKAPVFIRPVLSRLCTEPVSLRVHWMPSSVLQAQQDTAGDIHIYINVYRYLLWVLPSCSLSRDFVHKETCHSCSSVRSSYSP